MRSSRPRFWSLVPVVAGGACALLLVQCGSSSEGDSNGAGAGVGAGGAGTAGGSSGAGGAASGGKGGTGVSGGNGGTGVAGGHGGTGVAGGNGGTGVSGGNGGTGVAGGTGGTGASAGSGGTGVAGGNGGAPAGGNAGSSGSGGAGGSIMLSTTATITLPASAVAAALDDKANRLYVSMKSTNSQGSSVGAGIAVIDTTTNTVVATIPNPMGSFSLAVLALLAVDSTAHKLYMAEGGLGETVWVADGATNAVTGTIPVGAMKDFHGQALAIDEAAGKVYVGVSSNSQTGFEVIDTTSLAPGPVQVIADLNGVSGLAIDPKNQLLFVCGSASSNDKAACDSFSTTTLAPTGTPSTYSVDSSDIVGVAGGDGTAAMLLLNPGGPANLALLEPALVEMPSGFKPERLGAPHQFTPGQWEWLIVGTRAGVESVLSVNTCGEKVAGFLEAPWISGASLTNPLLVGPRLMVLTPEIAPGSDAGAPDPEVYIVSLDTLAETSTSATCCVPKEYSGCSATLPCCGEAICVAGTGPDGSALSTCQ